MTEFSHAPVMLQQIVSLAEGRQRAVDCTVGGGGHARALIDLGLTVLGIDRDNQALAAARDALGTDAELVHGTFGDVALLRRVAEYAPDFVLMDLGVSSWQLDADERGFSFRRDVDLDMRMDGTAQTTGADLLNSYSERELARVFADFGDERKARALARQVVRRRASRPFAVSDDLVGAIRATLGPRSGPAEFARLFQAVRIAVNGELQQLAEALPVLFDAMVPGGVLAVISYHSGEDRIVKNTFADWARSCICPPEVPFCSCRGEPLGERVTRKPISPDQAEAAANPRSRSARLRAFRKAAE